MKGEARRELLIDVSRLLWRLSSGRLPTGIDRVALEYFSHFGPRSQAVVQYRGHVFVLSPADTDRLLELTRGKPDGFKRSLWSLAPGALLRCRRKPPKSGMIYLNTGHTGLDQRGLVAWIDRYRAKAVFLVHDLIPITHARFCRPGEDKRHALRIRNALSSASGIIGNSEATLDALAHFARNEGLSMPPSIAALLGVPDLPGDAPAAPADRPYFVVLGTIEARKNHLLLLKTWKRLVSELGEDSPMLVIIGQRGWEAEAVFAILDDPGPIGAHVLELNHVADDELARWLAGARALLMPSFAEGFGLPVIEALQLGTPVIAADLRVYREIAGDIPLYLDPQDDSSWRQAIEEFAGSSNERSRQIEAAANYRAPDWQGHFARVEAFLVEVASG